MAKHSMGNGSNRKLFSNFISLGIVQGINFIIPLLVVPYVISRIGAAEFGSIAVAQVVMIYLSTVSDYGFNLSATRDIALHKGDTPAISKIFSVVLSAKLLIMIILLALLLLVALCTPWLTYHFTLYVLGFTYVIGQSIFVNWLFQGTEKMHYITFSTLLSKIVFVVLVFIFIQGKGDGKYFLFFLGIGNIISGILSLFIALYVLKLKFTIPAWKEVWYEIEEGWQITFSNLSINTYLYSGIFILRIFTSDLIVGYYSIAERIFFAARQVLAVFSQVVYPHICQLGVKGKRAGALFFKQVYLPFLLATIVGSAILFIFSPQIVFIFIKDQSTMPVTLLRLLSVVPVIVCLNIPAYQLLLAFNHKKSYLKIFTAATVVNIAANILLVNVWGATGTVLSIMITELFITTALNIELYKKGLFGFIYE